jgi:hypothetical protein
MLSTRMVNVTPLPFPHVTLSPPSSCLSRSPSQMSHQAPIPLMFNIDSYYVSHHPLSSSLVRQRPSLFPCGTLSPFSYSCIVLNPFPSIYHKESQTLSLFMFHTALPHSGVTLSPPSDVTPSPSLPCLSHGTPMCHTGLFFPLPY